MRQRGYVICNLFVVIYSQLENILGLDRKLDCKEEIHMKLPERITINYLREEYKKGTLTPREVIENIIEKAAELERFNIWICPPTMEKIGKYLDNLGDMDFEKKPLWGIPFAVKDNIDLEGYETTAACPKYGYKPTENAGVVERLINAGAIPLGKTNLDQFATGLVGTRSPYGECHNSINEELISGGSSSGSAVAVALGEAVFSLGTDTAGSGRVPASLNNLIGYKPTVGAWPSKGVVPACASLDCVTVFANNMDDIDLVDSIARGYDSTDKWSKDVKRGEDGLPSEIIYPLSDIDFYGPFKDEYKEAWEKSLKKIKATGIKVEAKDTSFYQKAALLLYGGPCVAERWSDLGEFVTNNAEDVFPVTRTILESGNRPDYTAEALYKTLHELRGYKLMSDNLVSDAILVFPTCAGTYTRDEVRANPIETNSDMGKYTNHCNLLDMCAIAVPTEIMSGSKPFGVTLFSKAENEHLLMGLAKKLLNE